jgi:hypothetical protein
MMRNVWDQVTTKTPGDERLMRRLVDEARTPDGYAALVNRFEAGASRRSLMGRFDERLNLVEYGVHHEDLRRGSGPVAPATCLRPSSTRSGVARLILKRAYRKAPVGVELAPDAGAVMPVRRGPSAVTVSGSRLDLILHAFGRRGAADVQVDGSTDGVSSFTRWATRA